MYRVFLINFDNRMLGEYGTFDAALEAGKKAHFEFSVYKDKKYMGYWSPVGGWYSPIIDK